MEKTAKWPRNNPSNRTIQRRALETLALDPNNEQRFLDDIHRKVKEDDVAVIDTFHTGLSTYMEPNNLIHKSQSGSRQNIQH